MQHIPEDFEPIPDWMIQRNEVTTMDEQQAAEQEFDTGTQRMRTRMLAGVGLFLVLAVAFCASKAFAAVTAEWRVNLIRGSTTVSPASVGATQEAAWSACQARIPTSAAAKATYKCQTPVYVAVVTPDPVPPPPPANVAPTISGVPAAAVEAGQAYSYAPVAADADGDTLAFTVANKPTWATFSSSTGALTGTPAAANVGISSGVKITVSDGKASASTPVFTITVTAATPPPTGTGVLTCSTSPYGQLFGACPSASFGAPTGTQAVLFCSDVVTQGAARETCPGAIWYSWAGIQGYSVVLTHQGWYERSQIPTGPPPALTAPTLSATRSANQTNPANSNVTLSWGAIVGATGYQVERCSGAGCANYAALATVTVLTYPNTNLPGGLSLSYRVRAMDSTRQGPYSNVETVVTPTAPPPAAGAASLSWTTPTQNTDGSTLNTLAGYRIVYGATANALVSTIDVSNPAVSAYVVGGLPSGTWYFAVRAYTSAGYESDNSNVASKVVP